MPCTEYVRLIISEGLTEQVVQTQTWTMEESELMTVTASAIVRSN